MLIVRLPQIWADAVCINQNDLDERSSQVNIMGDIFKAATKCQIWLGTVEDVIDWPDEKVVSAFLRSQSYDFATLGERISKLPPVRRGSTPIDVLGTCKSLEN